MAAVARAPLRLTPCMKLRPLLPSNSHLLRLASTATGQGKSNGRSSSSNAREKTTNPGKPVRRFVPDDFKRFFKHNGKLLTTRENVEFLMEHDLEPDNGTMTRFNAGPELQAVASEFSVTFAWSPRHVIHPYDLKYFEPRGHPLAAMTRARYLRKTLEEPLWVMVMSAGCDSAVVRRLPQRRMKAALYRALEARGYKAGGVGEGKEIRGTLWVTIYQPVKAANSPAERFGRVVAAALDKQCSRRRT